MILGIVMVVMELVKNIYDSFHFIFGLQRVKAKNSLPISLKGAYWTIMDTTANSNYTLFLRQIHRP